MKIFIVTREDYDCDEHDAYMVRAESIDDVLRICNDKAFTKENATIEEITLDGESEILLSSFNAG